MTDSVNMLTFYLEVMRLTNEQAPIKTALVLQNCEKKREEKCSSCFKDLKI